MRRQEDPYNGPRTLGIDVSRYQNEIDWDAVATSKVKFAIARTGDGKDYDSRFIENWQGIRRVGLVRGSYHYFRADRDGKYQAERVLSRLEEAGGFDTLDLPPALDLEGGSRKNLPGGVVGGTTELPLDLVVEECLEFLDLIEKELNVLPLVYTGQAFHWWLSQERPDLAAEFDKYPLWTPDYRSVPRVPSNTAGDRFPWSHWTIWQYTSKEVVPGIEDTVDANFFRGDEAAFMSFVKSLHKSVEMPSIFDYERCIRNEMATLIRRLGQLQEALDQRS